MNHRVNLPRMITLDEGHEGSADAATSPPLSPPFQNGTLVSVERKHFRLEGCLMGVEKLDPKTYAKT